MTVHSVLTVQQRPMVSLLIARSTMFRVEHDTYGIYSIHYIKVRIDVAMSNA